MATDEVYINIYICINEQLDYDQWGGVFTCQSLLNRSSDVLETGGWQDDTFPCTNQTIMPSSHEGLYSPILQPVANIHATKWSIVYGSSLVLWSRILHEGVAYLQLSIRTDSRKRQVLSDCPWSCSTIRDNVHWPSSRSPPKSVIMLSKRELGLGRLSWVGMIIF